MRLITRSSLWLTILAILLAQLIVPSIASVNTEKHLIVQPLMVVLTAQSQNLHIFGPNNDPNPVVNENNQIALTVFDSNGQKITSGLSFQSDSSDIASVDSQGVVSGKQQGFATITASKGTDSVSITVVVARVTKGKGKKVPGNTALDTSGAIYLSNPPGNVILKRDITSSDATVFAGQLGVSGKSDGLRTQAQFSSPTAVAIDNRPNGGIYITDTLNHNIRKVDFNNQVTTILGKGSSGVNNSDLTDFSQAAFNNPQGIAADSGGNLYIADTGNNAIYYADFTSKKVRLLAGTPGMAGKIDGQGRGALFNRPTAISVQSGVTSFFSTQKQQVLLVADTGNNVVRSVKFDGTVTTIGKIASTTADFQSNEANETNQTSNDISFDTPTSISTDDLGNIYVVDKSGVKIVTTSGQSRQVVSLAQAGSVSFNQAVSVTVQGNTSYVLDASSTSDTDAVNVVTVGSPQIMALSRNTDFLTGGAEVLITGKNFAPESLVILGDKIVNAVVESATRIRILQVPSQKAPGKRTLSVLTRGGVAQSEFKVTSPTFSALSMGQITTIAGGIPFLGDGGLATNAIFGTPQGITIDGTGNIYIADAANSRIRRIDSSGVVVTIAGNGAAGFSGDGGPAIGASLNLPRSVAFDGVGNLYILDSGNNRVRRVDTTGTITTVAGTGNTDYNGDGILATNANLNFSTFLGGGVTVDSVGNIFIAEATNQRVRRVDAKTKLISTIAGTGAFGFSGDGGQATNAKLFTPAGVAVDNSGNVFIADSDNNRIRQVNLTTGVITTLAGNGVIGFGGDGGQATNASLNSPLGIMVDEIGNVFVADIFNNRIRRIDAQTKTITTVAGNGIATFSGDGGQATNASLNIPIGLVIDGNGNLIIADQTNNRIRRVDARTKIISTIGGIDPPNGDGDLAINATIIDPFSVVVDKDGNLIIADSENHRIRKIDAKTGIITTIAGTGVEDFSGDNGPALNATFSLPTSLALDSRGNLFIADTGNQRIRRIDAVSSIITTVAGNGIADFSGDGSQATVASLNRPFGVALDSAGNIYIADTINCRIRRVNALNGIITTVAGNGNADLGGDGGLATRAQLFFPGGVAIDRNNNILIADGTLGFLVNISQGRIRQIDANTGIITTIAGSTTPGFGGDGALATNGRLNSPLSLTTDSANNIFINDGGNQRIRRVDAITKIITTVAGNGNTDYSGDGGLATNASLAAPRSVTIDSDGNLIIAAGNNDALRKVKLTPGGPTGSFSLIVSPNSQTISPGDSTSFTVNVQSINGFSQQVSLSAIANPASNDVSVSISPSLVTPGVNAMLTVKTSANIQPGLFSINIFGQDGRVTMTQTASVNVMAKQNLTPVINNAVFSKPQLTITGSKFSGSTAVVMVNGQNVSSRLVSQTDTTIVLQGNKKKLGLRGGTNQITVSIGGLVSNTFVLNLLSKENEFVE